MAISTTLPPIQGPTAKEKRYDRQLRLWAANGQQALEQAHILLLGSSAVGVETLKNLVLPGIGAFTIVDDATVEEEDLGANFFLEEDSLGRSRAVETARLLGELNPEVRGVATSQSPRLWITNSDLSLYSLIIVVGPVHRSILTQAAYEASRWSTPLFYVRSVGFYSTITINLPKLFPIVETHPDPESTQDLRLLLPWRELQAFARSRTAELDSMSDDDRGHVPYLLLLLHYLDQWYQKHSSYPTTYREKTQFRDIVGAEARTSTLEGGEENFNEAVSAVLKALNPPTVPSGLREIFEEPECQYPTSASVNFWIIAHALKVFVEKNSVLPLPGSIPDMRARSAEYIALQNVYRSKAQSDVAAVTVIVRRLEQELNRTPVDGREIEAFCKAAAFAKLARGRDVPDFITEVRDETDDRKNTVMIRELEDPESLASVYLCLESLDAVVSEAGTEAGTEAGSAAKDVGPALDKQLEKALGYLKSASSGSFDVQKALKSTEKVRQEITRSGPVELHNISSLTGGMAAQEVIKVITKQYIPIDNTLVYNGVTSRTATFRF